jgi:tetratricopeptide (TPR) repeat protein
VANVESTRKAARAALNLCGETNDSRRLALLAEGSALEDDERSDVRLRCYELTLILAEAVSQAIGPEDPIRQAKLALEILGQASRLRPPTRVYHIRRAAYLERLGDQAEADREYRIAEETGDSWTPSDDFFIGESYYRSGQLNAAIEHFKRVLSREPDRFWSQYLLAICYVKAQRPAEAQAALIACQGRRPDFVWIYLLRGFAEGELREFDLAAADFQRAESLGLSPEARYVLLVNRGVVAIRRNDDAAAIADFEAAIDLKPDHFQAYANLAQLYVNNKQWEPARRALDRALRSNPDQAILYHLRAQSAEGQGDEATAIADLDEAVQRLSEEDPLRAAVQLDRGRHLHRLRRHREALAAYEQSLAVRPDQIAVHRLRGVVLMELGRYDESIREFDYCLANGRPSAGLYEVRGLAQAWRGSYPEAIADYTMALKFSEGRGVATIRTHRAWAYLFSGSIRLAEREFTEAIQRDPACVEAYSGRGLALAQLRQPAEALADAETTTRLGHSNPRMIYNAARIYCQVAAGYQGLVGQLNDREFDRMKSSLRTAAHLIRKSVSMLPADERATFWQQVVRDDAVLAPVRRQPEFQELEASYGQVDAHSIAVRDARGRRILP